MFTWSFGWTSSPASVAITSFAFMLELVPEPVWKTSMGNWSSNSPVAMRSPAEAMRSARARSRSSRSAFTRAAAALMRPSQRATGVGIGSPETGKFATAFSVSIPQSSCFSTASAIEASLARPRQTPSMEVVEAQGLWNPVGTYLNTASYGLPPTAAWEALQVALEDWRGGRTSWEHWGLPGEDARTSFARLVGVGVGSVAIAANVSTLIGMVAASVPDGSSVLAPEVDFTSVLFPFMAQADRGVSVRLVPAAELAGEISAGCRRRRVQRRPDGDR